MQSQAHDAINKVDVHDKTHPAAKELDRIGGKTHLISTQSTQSPSASSPEGSSPASTPSSTYTGTTYSVTSSFYDPVSNATSNSTEIHPVLINDMRTFEGFGNPSTMTDSFNAMPLDFDFDLSQAFPLPTDTRQPPDFQHMQDFSVFAGTDFFAGGTANMMPPADTVMLAEPSFDEIPNSMGGMNVPVPELHATWQSFVEQLGFKF